MKYMIHSCTSRFWYVKDYLIPSMIDQGIDAADIDVWLDEERRGNLYACMESFRECGKHPGGTWHMQDDVVICSDFAVRTIINDKGIVCGYAYERDVRKNGARKGSVRVPDMWWSFQCIRIPNALAGQCAEWFYEDAFFRESYRQYVSTGKNDDYFLKEFLLEKHMDIKALNLAPNLVDHIDFLIGGSVINRDRGRPMTRAAFWSDISVVKELEKKLKKDKRARETVLF